MSRVPLELLHERFKLAQDLARGLVHATEFVQSADFEARLQALAALAAESPEAQRARLDARARIRDMGNQLSSMAQQLGYVQTWLAGTLPDVPARAVEAPCGCPDVASQGHLVGCPRWFRP